MTGEMNNLSFLRMRNSGGFMQENYTYVVLSIFVTCLQVLE